jgi:hypothetical protein
MKTFIAILASAFLICGCGQAKFESGQLSWSLDAVLYTNQNLIIFAKGGPIQTNVDSLDQAENILGQYGWELASTDVENGDRVYHMKRRQQEYGRFYLIPKLKPLPPPPKLNN